MKWNRDISQAPKGGYVTETRRGKNGQEIAVQVYRAPKIIAAGNGKTVTASRWLPEDERGGGGRWECFTRETPPLAWMPWPSHPDDEAGHG